MNLGPDSALSWKSPLEQVLQLLLERPFICVMR